MAGHVIDYYNIKPDMQGTKTEANLMKHWKGKAVTKMKAQLYQHPIRNDARQLSAILGEFATNSYIHAAHFHQALWGPYQDIMKNLSMIKSVEHEHGKHTFPQYAKTAREEGFEEIALAFEAMAQVDDDQWKKIVGIMGKLRSDTIFSKEEEQEWYCTRCGCVHKAKTAPENCSLCKAEQRFFEIKGSNFSVF